MGALLEIADVLIRELDATQGDPDLEDGADLEHIDECEPEDGVY